MSFIGASIMVMIGSSASKKGEDKMKRNFKYVYVVSSERGCWDETNIELYTNAEYSVGQWIILDGIKWIVLEVVKKERS